MTQSREEFLHVLNFTIIFVPLDLRKLIISYLSPCDILIPEKDKKEICFPPFRYDGHSCYGHCKSECEIWLRKLMIPPENIKLYINPPGVEKGYYIDLNHIADEISKDLIFKTYDPVKGDIMYTNRYQVSHSTWPDYSVTKDTIYHSYGADHKQIFETNFINEWLAKTCKYLQDKSEVRVEYDFTYYLTNPKINLPQILQDYKMNFRQLRHNYQPIDPVTIKLEDRDQSYQPFFIREKLRLG